MLAARPLSLRRLAAVLLVAGFLLAPLGLALRADVPGAIPVPSTLILSTGDPEVEESVTILRGVADEGGYGRIRHDVKRDASEFLATLRATKASTLVLAAHGTAEGILVGSETIPWARVSAALDASGVDRIILMACDSAALVAPDGVTVAKAYEGDVDLEVAALDAAYALADGVLDGAQLTRYADAHTEYVEANGGVGRFIRLMMEAERPLRPPPEDTENPCTAQWSNWRYPGSARLVGSNTTCGPMFISSSNPSCTHSNVSCRATAQEQEGYEQEIEKNSRAKFKAGAGREFLDGLISVGADVHVDGTDYRWYVGVGGSPIKPEKRMISDRLQGPCWKWGDLTDFVAPVLNGIEHGLSALPGVHATVEGLSFFSCASLEGGLIHGRRAGTIEGTLDFRAVSGVHLEVSLWWITKTVRAELTAIFPFGVSADIEDDPVAHVLTFDVKFSWGPPRVEVSENMFDTYFAIDIPIATGEKDLKTFRWDYSWWVQGGSAQSASQVRFSEAELAARIEDALRYLPSEVVQLRTADAATSAAGPGTVLQIADILELKPGDAMFNALVHEGVLDALGVDAAAIPAGQALFLDLSDPGIYALVYGGPTDRAPALLGLPGGYALAGASCPTQHLGGLVAVRVEDCDPSRATVGLGFTADDIVTGASPADPARTIASGARETAMRTSGPIACLGTPLYTSPTSGRTYSLQWMCDALNHEATLAGGMDVTRKAVEGHTAKVTMIKNGLTGWLTDACSLAATSATAKASGTCVRSTGQLISTTSVLNDLTGGITMILNTQSGEEFGSTGTMNGLHLVWWGDNEPIGPTITSEIPAGGPVTIITQIVNGIECSVGRMIHPDHPGCPGGA